MQRYEVLWAVHSFSLKWRALQRRREVRRAAFQEALAEAIDDDKAAIQECLDALEAAQSPEVRFHGRLSALLQCLAPKIQHSIGVARNVCSCGAFLWHASISSAPSVA